MRRSRLIPAAAASGVNSSNTTRTIPEALIVWLPGPVRSPNPSSMSAMTRTSEPRCSISSWVNAMPSSGRSNWSMRTRSAASASESGVSPWPAAHCRNWSEATSAPAIASSACVRQLVPVSVVSAMVYPERRASGPRCSTGIVTSSSTSVCP